MKKIGIITQPLETNYGGILQNYALQEALRKLGYDSITLDQPYIDKTLVEKLKGYIYFIISKILQKNITRPRYLSKAEKAVISSKIKPFIDENIKHTEKLHRKSHFTKAVKKYNLDAVIVGSDQVWRPMYTKNIYNAFLDFCQNIKGIKRIAYAASFGVTEWEFNKEQTQKCTRLVNLFDAVSVREESGVDLCRKHLNVEAKHVLDPTLLLEKEDYIKLIKSEDCKSNGNMFCYILDNNASIQQAIHEIEQQQGLKSFMVKAKKAGNHIPNGENTDDYVKPSADEWIRAFVDAEMVFTDSFHGTVFSIIFNKPFWVIGNKERGNARFDSLLKQFDLESRRIDVSEINDINITEPVDWVKVNSIKKEWQKKSVKFIKDNL